MSLIILFCTILIFSAGFFTLLKFNAGVFADIAIETPQPFPECRKIYGERNVVDARFLNNGCILTCKMEDKTTNHTLWEGYQCNDNQVFYI